MSDKARVVWAIAGVSGAALFLSACVSLLPFAFARYALQAVLFALALFEARNALLLTFFAASALPRASYVCHPGGHGLHQEFGVYGWAISAAFALGASNPVRHSWVIAVALFLEFSAGAMHLSRAAGWSFGDVKLFRPTRIELGEGIYHFVCGVALLALVPWVWSGAERAAG